MYESFFGLQSEPFSVAPDPRFLYMSDKHREALSHLNYGLRRGGGFVLLTGEIGAGKTTVWRAFLEQLPDDLDVAYIVNPKLGVQALLTKVCENLQLEVPADTSAFDPVDALHGHLLLADAGGRRTLIVVDEAQALAPEVLEQLRLLTNLVTGERKLVQVLLIGQPELRTILEQPAMEPLAQRVVARFHLTALTEAETTHYIGHRLSVAGLQGEELPFDTHALYRIHKLCGGVPRRINVLCDRALLAAHAAGQRRVTEALVDQAAGEVFGRIKPAAAAAAANTAAAVAMAQHAAGHHAPHAPHAPHAVVLHTQRRSHPGRWAAGAAVAAALGVAWWHSPWRIAAAPRPQAATARPGETAPAPLAQPAGITRAEAAPTPIPTPASTPASASGASSVEPALARPVTAAAPFTMPSADEAQAWRVLATLWSLPPPKDEPCAASAEPPPVLCYRGRGGLVPIRQIDRPVILKLADERGRTAHLVLTRLTDEAALLRVGKVEHEVPLSDLARYWRGEFATFWRPPPGYAPGASLASGSPLGTWLAEHLARIDRQPAPRTADELKARIYAFQVAHALPPDGVAGPITLMQIGRLSGAAPEPQLKARP